MLIIDYFAVKEYHLHKSTFYENYAIYIGVAQFFNQGLTLYLTYFLISN